MWVQPYKYNEERRFGVEFEVINKDNSSQEKVQQELSEAGIAFDNRGYMHNTNSNNLIIWTIKDDSSIMGNFGGFEIVSPVLKGSEGLAQVEKVCNILVKYCSVNKSTGFHVHHEAVDLKDGAFRNLFNLYKNFSPIINYFVSASRRNNHYCRVPDDLDLYNKKSPKAIKRALVNTTDRYRAVNFTSYAIRGTIEFRQHQGTVDAKKAVAWIVLTQAMIETAKSKVSIASKRASSTITPCYLFDFIGWVPKYLDEKIIDMRAYFKERYRIFKKELVNENSMEQN